MIEPQQKAGHRSQMGTPSMPRGQQVNATLAVFVFFVVYDWLYWEVLFTELSSTPVSWLWFHGATAVMADRAA